MFRHSTQPIMAGVIVGVPNLYIGERHAISGQEHGTQPMMTGTTSEDHITAHGHIQNGSRQENETKKENGKEDNVIDNITNNTR